MTLQTTQSLIRVNGEEGMKTIRQKSIITLIVLFVLSLFLALTIAPLSTKAEDSKVFQMENGAQLYLAGDAIRFIAKMDETTYKEIVTDDESGNVSLKILVGPRRIFDQVEDGKYMSIADEVVEFDIPDSKIYNVGDYFYANARLQNLNSDKLTVRQMDLDFVAIAVKVTKSIADEQEVLSYEYAKFADDDIANNTRSQYDMVNETVLGANVDLATVILAPESAYSKWYGSSNYPIVPKTDAQAEALDALIEAELVDANELKIVADCKYYTSERQSAGFGFYHTIDDQIHKCACGAQVDFAALRTGEDANTVLFLEREEGKLQLAASDGIKVNGYNAEMNAAEIAVNIASYSLTSASISFDAKGYEFNANDYILAEAMSVGGTITLRVPANGLNNATLLNDGVWAYVLAPATAVSFQIFDKIDATLYIRNVKAIPASEVKDIATTGDETIYKLSSYDFVGGEYATASGVLGSANYAVSYSAIQGVKVGACAWSLAGDKYSQASDVLPYYVNGQIRFYVRAHQKNGMDSAKKVVLKSANAYNFTSGIISVVVRGVLVTDVTLLGSGNGVSCAMVEDANQEGVPAGYVRYAMSKSFDNLSITGTINYFIFTVSSSLQYCQASIIDITLPVAD